MKRTFIVGWLLLPASIALNIATTSLGGSAILLGYWLGVVLTQSDLNAMHRAHQERLLAILNRGRA